MFPKKQRIVKKKEIEKALKTPFRTGFDFGQILLFPRKNTGVSKNKLEKNLQIKLIQKNQSLNSQVLLFQKNEKLNNLQNNSAQNLDLKNTQLSLENKLENQKFEIKKIKIKEENKLKSKEKQEENIKNIKDFHKFRVLCIISKKIHKKANQRNKIRRRFITIFQQLDSQNRLPSNLDLTIIIRTKDILTAKFQDYQKIVPTVSRFYQKLRFQNKI